MWYLGTIVSLHISLYIINIEHIALGWLYSLRWSELVPHESWMFILSVISVNILIVFLNIFVWVINIALGWSYSVRWSELQLPGRTVASWHAHNYNYIHTMFTITYVRLCNTIVCNYKHFLTYLQLQWLIQCLSWHRTSLSITLSPKPFPLRPRWLIVVEFVCARVFLQVKRHCEVVDDAWMVLWSFVMLCVVCTMDVT